MRTTLDLPEGLLEKARRATGARTKRQAVVEGLQSLLRNRAYARLLRLQGKVRFSADPLALRGRPRR